MTPPVLYLIFNRPDLQEQSFVPIRAARPAQLFVAADGPRPDRGGEAERCAEARRIVEQVDWPCEVHTLFRDQNLGCRKAVSEAITWFFDQVEEGIILEDDCVADASFFPFCAELLERYRDEERIMAISGDNFQYPGFDCGASYFFTKYPHCWGWATWRGRWALYDDKMKSWPLVSKQWKFRKWFSNTQERRYWNEQFAQRYLGNIDSWAIAWLFASWCHGKISIAPALNLVQNIGWGSNATHTHDDSMDRSFVAKSIAIPLRHPRKLILHSSADITTDLLFFSGHRHSLLVRMKQIYWKWHFQKLSR